MQTYVRSGAVLAILMLVLAACQPGGGGASPGAEESAAAGESAPAAGQDAAAVCDADEFGCVEIPEGEPIHIAFWGVLSGPDAALGEDSRRGVEIAIMDRGGELLGREIRLSSQDALCTPEGGATATTALAADSTIVGLIGGVCSDETVGGIGSLTNAGMTTISPSQTRPALTAADRGPEYAGYLRTAHSDTFQGEAVAQFLFEELGAQTLATVHDGSAYAEALVGEAERFFEGRGGEVVASEAVERGQTDMSPVLTSIGAESPDVLFYPLFTAEFGFLTSQAADVPGLADTILMGADAGFSEDAINAAGPNAEGVYLSSPDFTVFGEEYAAFLETYESEYGSAPIQIFHAHGYDAANILMNAIEEVAIEEDGTLFVPRGALREAVYATENHPGITGTLSCTENGDCAAPVIGVYQVTEREIGGEWPPEAPLFSRNFGEEPLEDE